MAERQIQVVTSELTLMEVLVGAHRANDPALEADYQRTLGNPLVRLWRIDRDVLGRAARLRASRPSLRTSDAVHLATAELSGCDVFVTNDKALCPSFPSVVLLNDLL